MTYPSGTMKVSTALTLYLVLSCLIGWVFFLGRALGAEGHPGQLPLAPIIAAAIVSAAQGRASLRAWGRRLLTLRAPARWYLVAFLAPVVILVAAVLINAMFGAPLPTGAELSAWPAIVPTFVLMLLVIGIAEEAGWTAFAAPLLLERHRLIRAWLILASMRTAWHIPLMLQRDLPLTIGIGGNFAFQLLVLWTFSRTGVWFLAAIWHAMLNTIGGEFLFGMVEGADRDRLGILMVAGYVIVAVVVWLFGLRPRDTGIPLRVLPAPR